MEAEIRAMINAKEAEIRETKAKINAMEAEIRDTKAKMDNVTVSNEILTLDKQQLLVLNRQLLELYPLYRQLEVNEPAPKRAKHGTFADCRLLRLSVSICGSNNMANACMQGAIGYVCVCMNTCSKTFPRTAVQSPHLFPCRTTTPQKQHQQER